MITFTMSTNDTGLTHSDQSLYFDGAPGTLSIQAELALGLAPDATYIVRMTKLPAGYRVVTAEDREKLKPSNAKYLGNNGKFYDCLPDCGWSDSDAYIVPVEPPKPKKWWFNTATFSIRSLNDGYRAGEAEKACGWLEVSEAFAKYIENKPDEPCEIRKVETGVVFSKLLGGEWVTATGALANSSLEPPYRWCRPRKPETVPVVRLLRVGEQACTKIVDVPIEEARKWGLV